mgnify:CR=1 FL=1
MVVSKNKQPKIRVLFSYISSRKLPILISIFYFVIVLVLLLNRFWQYEVFYYDHGYAERAAYQVSHLQNPTWDRDGRVSIFTDHVYPSLLLLFAPFYWIWDSYLTPVVILAVLWAAIPLIAYEIGFALKINKFMLYSLMFAFLFFIGTQNAIIFFLKDISVSIPFFLLLLLAILKRKIKLYYLLLLLNLGFKETITVTIISLGIGLILFYDRSFRKHAVATIIISVVYGLFISRIFVPFVIFKSYGHLQSYGFNPDFIPNPLYYLYNLFNTPQKRETIIASLSAFGFLPLFTPFGFLLMLQDFAQRFVLIQANSPLRQGLNLHYNISLAAIMFFGSALTVSKFQTKKFYKKLIYIQAVLIIIGVIIMHRFIYHGPFGLLYNKDFFKITSNMKFMDDFVNKIPKNGKIMTQNNLAVRFTHNDLYILSSKTYVEQIQPDVIAMDFRPGQNINNYWPMTTEKMVALARDLKENPNYESQYSEEFRYIFIKK